MKDEIIKIIADLVEKPLTEISLEMTLFADLGLESVEMLELAFTLEEEYGVQIEANALWRLPDYMLANDLYKDGKIVATAHRLITDNFQSINTAELAENTTPYDLLKYLTVDDVISYIKKRAN